MILSVDLGGTNARFAFCEVSSGRPIIQDLKVFSSQDFGSAPKLFSHFAASHDLKPSAAIIAVPGPVLREKDDLVARITNLPWTVALSQLKSALGIENSLLVNDVAAAASFLSVSKESDYRVLHSGSQMTDSRAGNSLLLSLGTGVGASQYLESKSKTDLDGFSIIPSELGHCAAPLTDLEELEFGNFLNSQGRKRSIEEAISGDGLKNCYRFISKKEISAAEVNYLIRDGKDPEAKSAFALYQKLLGKTLASLALAFSPSKGIYLAGGVSSKLSDIFDDQLILKEYLNFGELAHLREATDIRILNTENAGIIGAAALSKAGVVIS